MSDHGLSEPTQVATGLGSLGGDEVGPNHERPSETMASPSISTKAQEGQPPTTSTTTRSMPPERSPVEMRAHFDEFAAQMRSHRHHEHKRRMLEHRRRHLRKAISLSRRLRRLGCWMHDGLVEISQHGDAPAFVRVHQSIQDLTDVCFAGWSHDVQSMDAVLASSTADQPAPSDSFLSQLSQTSQQDCVDFIESVRSNPRFLVERFTSISPAQLKALSTSPRYKELEATILTSLSQNRGTSSQRKRIQSYSKTLEDYGASFERKNAISFLLHNCFGPDSTREDDLRTSTWSSICAALWLESPVAFDSVFGQVMTEFCALQTWRARERLELFLMDILQRGAFLLEPIGEYRTKAVLESHVSDTLDTDGARDFFDDAVRRLFEFLWREDGLPSGARQLANATLAKLAAAEDQNALRGHVFSWFMQSFLRHAVEFPEHEKMLLNFHISDSARNSILHQLWARAQARVVDCFAAAPLRPVDTEVLDYVNAIIGQLDPEYDIKDPYTSDEHGQNAPTTGHVSNPALTLCAADIIHVLEALNQQYMPTTNVFEPTLHFSSLSFQSQYQRASDRFDKLRRELHMQMEPGYSTSTEHACHERWLVLPLNSNGKIDLIRLSGQAELPIEQYLRQIFGQMDPVQEATLRLATTRMDLPTSSDLSTSPDLRLPHTMTIAELLDEQMQTAQSTAQNIDHFYWANALDVLHSKYSASAWARNDARILRPLIRQLDTVRLRSLSSLEADVQGLETLYSSSRQLAYSAMSQSNQLKTKMWYLRDVTNSREYESARNISRALNYMAHPISTLPESTLGGSSDYDRPGTSTSAASSMFEQSRFDAMEILKAPKEHGGPRKLADAQIENTRRWLERNSIENFCKGEERIHRFCMEIRTTTRKLVADTLTESPVLWSSDLWAKERAAYEVAPNLIPGFSGSTRPPSVMSETLSSTIFSTRPNLGMPASSSRSLDVDTASSLGRKSSFGLGSSRFGREPLGSDYSFSSPGRSLTTTSGDSVSGIWSSVQSQPRSMTSASLQSRAPSILNELVNLKIGGDSNAEKGRFLDSLQLDLTGLLLSDLGNPVWSLGSETDSWLDVARQNVSITTRMLRRKQTAQLIPEPDTKRKTPEPRKRRPTGSRRWLSTDDTSAHMRGTMQLPPPSKQDAVSGSRHAMLSELADILCRIRDQVNPMMKLQAVHDFKKLALLYLDKKNVGSLAPPSVESRRRRSLGPGTRLSKAPSPAHTPTPAHPPTRTEGEIVEYLRELLLELGPTTLFRDLQYIAAFTPSDTLNKTESGKAFFQLGLAAMASKDEYCRCMVDVADSIVAKDAIKRQTSEQEDTEQPLLKARQYWILASCEGNAIAQRELASLYLAHPELPPIVSLPMTLSSEIFKPEMMWQTSTDSNAKMQALCLAVHWMQQAANNGDDIAKIKLRERKETGLIR